MEKQQNVVFFIGAGFSAPFGLPVMANFINMARDLYFSDINKYTEIGTTLELIEKYSYVKSYMNVNLHNIEDLLSISYMESLIKKNTTLMKHINEFIKTVISAYTEDTKNGVLWFSHIVANLSFKNGSRYIPGTNNVNQNIFEQIPNGKLSDNSNYGIISLNYDLLIENALNKLADTKGEFYNICNEENIIKGYYKTIKDKSGIGVPMAKLHGSIDNYIVPPTWNKNINNHIQADWKLAIDLLSDATHIVFLGYSLPPTDNYIKYLLASSLNNNKRLKKISIITMDTDGETQNRYKTLFTLNPSFHNTDINNFFNLLNKFINNNGIDFDLFDDYFYKYCMNKDAEK